MNQTTSCVMPGELTGDLESWHNDGRDIVMALLLSRLPSNRPRTGRA